jgi:hypothetical protein
MYINIGSMITSLKIVQIGFDLALKITQIDHNERSKLYIGHFVLFNCLEGVCLLLGLEVKASVITIRGVNYSTDYSSHSIIRKTLKRTCSCKAGELNITTIVDGQGRKLTPLSVILL